MGRRGELKTSRGQACENPQTEPACVASLALRMRTLPQCNVSWVLWMLGVKPP